MYRLSLQAEGLGTGPRTQRNQWASFSPFPSIPGRHSSAQPFFSHQLLSVFLGLCQRDFLVQIREFYCSPFQVHMCSIVACLGSRYILHSVHPFVTLALLHIMVHQEGLTLRSCPGTAKENTVKAACKFPISHCLVRKTSHHVGVSYPEHSLEQTYGNNSAGYSRG